MKKLILILAFLFVYLSLFAQEPIVKFYLEDGSVKAYNISEIENISVLTGSSNYIMNIYEHGSKISNFPTKSIESIKFETDAGNNQLLNIYISSKANSFKLLEIDSINFTKTEESLPQITSINPNSGKIGDEITINGKNFGDSQSTGFVSFNGTNATTYTSWSSTEIKVKVPTGAMSGKLSVTVNGKWSNEVDFVISTPNQLQIVSISPKSARIGDEVVIKGSKFGASQGTSKVSFNGTNPTEYLSWSDAEIKTKIPKGAKTGKVSVTVNNEKSNELDFSIIPWIAAITPIYAGVSENVTLTGSGFSDSVGTSKVSFNKIDATNFLIWNDSTIKAEIPQKAETGMVSVTVGTNKSNEVDFTVIPNISSINPTSARIGDEISISGSNFGANQDMSLVSFNSLELTDVTSWNDTLIKLKVPQGAEGGKIFVTVQSNKSNEVLFTIIPFISGINPEAACIRDEIIITGTGFKAIQGKDTVFFNGIKAVEYVSWCDTVIVVKVPSSAVTGKVVVMIKGVKSNEMDFGIIPKIDSINPTSARIGDEIKIQGTGFGKRGGTSVVSFQSIETQKSNSWTASEIILNVPMGAETGKISVYASDLKSNEIDFTILPKITATSSLYVKIGDEITLYGTSFGNEISSSIVSFNNINVIEIISWSSTKIIVKVPELAKTGKVSITVNNNKSNEINIYIIPFVSGINPTIASIGDIVVISGNSFGSIRGLNVVSFTGKVASEYTSWSDNEINVKVPIGANTGNVSVKVEGIMSNNVDFTVDYESIQIGSQVWMLKNLDVTTYRNGDTIPQGTLNNYQWGQLTTGAWNYFIYDLSNADVYGNLYNWYAVNDSRGLAPTGWHVPTDSEWATLINYLGGKEVAGGKLKEAGLTHWDNPNEGATNESGFTALPGGCRCHINYSFDEMGVYAKFWSSSGANSYQGISTTLYFNSNRLSTGALYMQNGFSVRCVKD